MTTSDSGSTEEPRSKPRPKTRRGFVVLGLVFLALIVGWRFKGLVRAVVRGEKKPVRVVELQGESKVLPRSTTPAGPERAGLTSSSLHSIEVGGQTRQYVLVEPHVVDGGKKLPLVLAFHGDGGQAGSFHDAWRFEEASGADAFVAYPNGLGYTWDNDSVLDNRDVKFVEALVNELAERLPIDRMRVFAAGYSSGGFLSNVVACQKPGLFRAIASNAGGAPYQQALVWPNGYTRCPGQKPIAMLALHGERDYSVTFDSGRFSAEYWAYVNGCTEDEMEPSGYEECRVYRGCADGKAVGFCRIAPLGHWVWDRSAEASWVFFNTQSQ